MNKLKKTLYILTIVALAGCDSYLDINDDPNNPTEAPLSGLLARTSFETGDNLQNVSSITSYYVQYLASPNQASSTDTMEPIPYDQTWFELYDVMTDISDLEVLAETEEANHYLGIGKIIKAINLMLTVDAWGDVPYSDAFFAETIKPAYDTDSDLYGTIGGLLDEGISLLSQPNGNESFIPGDDDFIYEGDIDLWIKAAHALKARMLIHESDVSGFNPQDVLDEVEASFTSPADDASVEYYDVQINPWASVAISNANLVLGGWISEQLVDMMDGSLFGVVDPRMPYMFGSTDEGEFVGTPNGAGRGDAAEQGERSVLIPSGYYSSRTSSLEIITYPEVKFIEAEAALMSDPSRAYEAYMDGITSHMETIGVPSDEIADYISDPAVAVGSSNLTKDLIFREKYKALFLNPETWNDARRHDYGYEGMTTPANLSPDLNGNFARRLIYPESETQRNAINVPSITMLDRIWWDQE